MSSVHDIRKIGIPEEILNKPGKLTAEEFEIMKSHTTIGDALLGSTPASFDDPMMRTAHEICRWHHERGTAAAIPTGSRGMKFPSPPRWWRWRMLYDALTSERCYKPAFSHEDAIWMILNGECGTFNPLLLTCLKAVAEKLTLCMQADPSNFDYRQESQHLADEILEQQSLPVDNRAQRLLPIEREKTAFFARQCGGIQFVYDRWMHRIVCTDYDAPPQKRQSVVHLAEGESPALLSPADLQRLRQEIHKATPEHPEFSLDVQVVSRTPPLPCRLRVRIIWPQEGDEYGCVVGQFTPIDPQAAPAAAEPAGAKA